MLEHFLEAEFGDGKVRVIHGLTVVSCFLQLRLTFGSPLAKWKAFRTPRSCGFVGGRHNISLCANMQRYDDCKFCCHGLSIEMYRGTGRDYGVGWLRCGMKEGAGDLGTSGAIAISDLRPPRHLRCQTSHLGIPSTQFTLRPKFRRDNAIVRHLQSIARKTC
jgi:hypothetical protein